MSFGRIVAPVPTEGNKARASNTGGYWYGVQPESGSALAPEKANMLRAKMVPNDVERCIVAII